MTILILGATGFIGKALCSHLGAKGHIIKVLTRNLSRAQKILGDRIQLFKLRQRDIETIKRAMAGTEAVINLSGENIGNRPWTRKQKSRILDSRLNIAVSLQQAINQISSPPSIWIQASAVGYYPSSLTKTFDETDEPGRGFLSDVCIKVESPGKELQDSGIRYVILRSGIVLGKGGGILPKMVLPFRFFIGGHFGTGKQWTSWIHLKDEIRAIEFLLMSADSDGIYNLTSPYAVTMEQLFKTVGQTMKRPSWFHIPGFLLKIFLGLMAEELLLQSQRVLPLRLQAENFKYHFPFIEEAIKDLLEN